jgi:hypothetical protein
MIPIIPSNHLKKVSSDLRKPTCHLGKSTLISLEVPPRSPGSPFKGIQGNQGEAILVVFSENIGIYLRRSTFNRSTFKEVRVQSLVANLSGLTKAP